MSRFVSPLFLAVLLLTPRSSAAQDDAIELGSGASTLLLLGPASGQAGLALDLEARGPIVRSLRWSGGTRFGLSPVAPEIFAGVALAPTFGSFLPALGLELGVGTRTRRDSNTELLREVRRMSREGMSPFYLGLRASPLHFRISEHVRIGTLDLLIGTQLSPFGRFVRFEAQLISVGAAL
jgi:hypothetical protein